jgi:hypothetical protein
MHGSMLVWALMIIGWGFALAWIADSAASRGRSQIAWVTVGVVITGACLLLTGLLARAVFAGARDAADGGSGEVGAMMFSLLVPLVLVVFALFGLGLWLKRQPVKIRTVRAWPVSCRINGNGKLEILPAAVRLVWGDRTQDIPRAELRSVAPDGECLRLAWSDGELTLLPMLSPQTRDGRIEQSQRLARLLATAPPDR